MQDTGVSINNGFQIANFRLQISNFLIYNFCISNYFTKGVLIKISILSKLATQKCLSTDALLASVNFNKTDGGICKDAGTKLGFFISGLAW